MWLCKCSEVHFKFCLCRIQGNEFYGLADRLVQGKIKTEALCEVAVCKKEEWRVHVNGVNVSCDGIHGQRMWTFHTRNGLRS